jgi:DNA-binding transcriptional ArsR family regulator
MAEKPQLTWEIGTAYDMFTSLEVLHNPDRYGLRGSWAAGVRSRLPVEQRDMLQLLLKKAHMWAIPWLTTLDGPKDSATVLEHLSEIPPAERLQTFANCYMWDDMKTLLQNVVTNGSWNEDDHTNLRTIYQEMYREEGIKKKIIDDELAETLDIWSQAEKYGVGMLEALKTYYEVFFAEEERRIRPALEETVAEASQLADKLTLEELLNQLSQGLRFDFDNSTKEIKELLMVPSFWTTPLSLFTKIDPERDRWIFLFGGRPANQSLVPGEVVPELLHQMLKALADPTRLRILRYLSEEPLTPAELARRLRLRPPTVIHHLDTMRLARLVHVTLSHQGRRYEARQEAIDAVCGLLNDFLN